MSERNLVTVTSSVSGVRFNVRLLQKGDRYGLNDRLVVGEGDSLRLEGEGPFVEFYDTRYPHTQYGQFVTRYGVSTLLARPTGTGLDLYGGVTDWKLDGAAMDIVRLWLLEETARVYSIGIPVAITVMADGKVTFDFDLSEVDDLYESDPAYAEDVVDADILTVSAAATTLHNHHSITTPTNA